MRAYSVDLRTRIVDAVDRQVGTQGTVATLFGVSRTVVKKLLRQRRASEDLAPKPQGGGPSPKLKEPHRAVLRTYIIKEQNDATLQEVQAYIARTLEEEGSQATGCRVLQSWGLPRKKTSGGQRAR